MRATQYIGVLLACLLGAFAFQLRSDDIFACPASAYEGGSYLAYCHAGGYGDFDHGAFWFGLEPAAIASAQRADVVFLGSSRMQFGLSSEATRAWFAATGRRHFLLGFSHTENIHFVAPLLRRLHLAPRAYVINVDQFFDERVTLPAGDLLEDATAESRYRRKQLWQVPHRIACGAMPVLCGNQLGFFRSPRDGAWSLEGSGDVKPSGVGVGKPVSPERWPLDGERGRAFVDSLGVPRECVFLSIVPSKETRLDEARAIATALGIELVAPWPDGLRTFDESHLDRASAERWSQAFFAAIGDKLRRCLG